MGLHTPWLCRAVDSPNLFVPLFVGNLHKWAFAPHGCAVLWIHPRLHDVIRPAITSRPHDDPIPANNFKRQGTEDASNLYTADVAIDEYRRLGGLVSEKMNRGVCDVMSVAFE